MKFEFNLEPTKMSYKSQELYNKILVDCIAPYYFVVIKESKYCDNLEQLQDKFRASIEYQSFAYSPKDYTVTKAHVLNGIVKHFSDYRTATRWLRDKVKENFTYTLKPNGESDRCQK